MMDNQQEEEYKTTISKLQAHIDSLNEDAIASGEKYQVNNKIFT